MGLLHAFWSFGHNPSLLVLQQHRKYASFVYILSYLCYHASVSCIIIHNFAHATLFLTFIACLTFYAPLMCMLLLPLALLYYFCALITLHYLFIIFAFYMALAWIVTLTPNDGNQNFKNRFSFVLYFLTAGSLVKV